MCFIVVFTFIDDYYASLLFSQTFFFVLSLHVERKGFEKKSLTRTRISFA